MPIWKLLVSLAVSSLLGLLISFVYARTRKAKAATSAFTSTLVLLPAVITVIIMLVGNDIARAFSLAGAFSIIRFRSAPGDPKDITFVLITMAVGLACGMGFIAYAVIAALALCGVELLLERVHYNEKKSVAQTLKITIPEDLDYRGAFDAVLARFTLKAELKKVKTTNLGSLFELSYSVATKQGISEKEFLDELRCRNGNLSITLSLDETTEEF